jgi:hypothetical protein
MGATKSLQGVFINDDDGNPVAVILDGSVYRLEMQGKVLNASGTQVNPATQETIAAVDTKLGTIDGVLDSIKDTDGVKKITDALPVGDNILGRMKLTDGTDVAAISTGGQVHFVMYDDVNNVALAVAEAVAVPANTRGVLSMAEDQTGFGRRLMTIEDATTADLHRLAIDGKVSIQISPPPPGGAKIAISADNPLGISNVTSPHITTWVIPDGKTLVIQQIIAGCQGDPSADGSKVEVYYDNGTLHLIDRIYIMGETQFGNYPDTDTSRDDTALVGNGTHSVKIYRYRLSNSTQEIDAVLRGYTI